MSSGKHVPVRPMTEEEASLVEGHYRHARNLAHRVWRLHSLPACHLEEMMSEAVLEMCRCVLRYSNYQDKSIPFSRMFVFSVSKRLHKYAADARRTVPLERGELLPCPEWDGEKSDIVAQAVQSLPGSQREVIEKRYGLDGNPPRTGHQTKDELGIPYSTMYQREHKALRNLEEWLRENGCGS